MIQAKTLDGGSLLEMKQVCKRFGATIALDNVEIAVRSGEVMALIGENGAGKSTLMKILSGAIQADSGELRLAGESYRPRSPHAARQAGVAMIYQELNLALDLTVEDNIMLGKEDHFAGVLNRNQQRERVRKALATLGHAELSPLAVVGSLSVGAQQLVEIARALVFDARLIVFDEPTSSLTSHDVAHLFEVIGKLRDAGIAVIYISHFLEEIQQLCDRYTVLRDGRSVGGGNVADADHRKIVSLMVGRSVSELFPNVPHKPGEVILRTNGLSGRPAPNNVSLELRQGEILGIAGLVGAGRTELLRTLFGLAPTVTGGITLRDQAIKGSPRVRIASGLGFVSEDRKEEGLAQNRSVAENITYSRLKPYSWWGWLNLFRHSKAVDKFISRMEIKTGSQHQSVASLSGGNQQKVAIARVLHQDADVWLLDEPTRGIDVGAKSEIYRLMGELAAEGKAILFVSSYLPELLAVCDSIGVMSRGELREVRATSDWSEESIMASAIGEA